MRSTFTQSSSIVADTSGYAVRQRLIEWYSDHYSANLMSLVILSSREHTMRFTVYLGQLIGPFLAQTRLRSSHRWRFLSTLMYPTLTCNLPLGLHQFLPISSSR